MELELVLWMVVKYEVLGMHGFVRRYFPSFLSLFNHECLFVTSTCQTEFPIFYSNQVIVAFPDSVKSYPRKYAIPIVS